MSGLRRCAECQRLFKIRDAGPEPMRPDGTFPRHVCGRCTAEKRFAPLMEQLRVLGWASAVERSPGGLECLYVRAEGGVRLVASDPDEGEVMACIERLGAEAEELDDAVDVEAPGGPERCARWLDGEMRRRGLRPAVTPA